MAVTPERLLTGVESENLTMKLPAIFREKPREARFRTAACTQLTWPAELNSIDIETICRKEILVGNRRSPGLRWVHAGSSDFLNHIGWYC